MLLAPLLVAQEKLATISGVISDPSGAVIPHAKVAATDYSGKVTTAPSDSVGVYTLRLARGDYRVEVTADGFQTSAVSTLKLGPMFVWIHNRGTLLKRLKIQLKWGLKDPRELETWHRALRLASF